MLAISCLKSRLPLGANVLGIGRCELVIIWLKDIPFFIAIGCLKGYPLGVLKKKKS